jgi:hypothetical protein
MLACVRGGILKEEGEISEKATQFFVAQKP